MYVFKLASYKSIAETSPEYHYQHITVTCRCIAVAAHAFGSIASARRWLSSYLTLAPNPAPHK